jgi:pimeloyl-ACP methyl ester carboxylesterase
MRNRSTPGWRFWGIALVLFAVSTSSSIAATLEREIESTSGEIRLAGTLVMPASTPRAAFVLVQGSGKVERALPLARQFASHGIAVYTYDKRGVGRSQGEYDLGGTVREQVERQSADVVAALTALAVVPELKQTPIGLFGISQAGWIIPHAATKSLPTFIALWSGPICSVREELHFSAVAEDDPAYLSTHSSEQIRDYMKTMPRNPDDYDPTFFLQELTVPGLWIFGGLDNSIPVGLSIERLSRIIENGQSNFEFKYYATQGHSLTDEDRAGFSYLVEWILRQTKSRSDSR